jgi:hypothetical protein
MNNVSGRILVKESNLGIPNLLIEIFDLDPGTKPEDLVSAFAADGTGSPPVIARTSLANLLSDRIGSILTDARGGFTLDYEDNEFRRRNPTEIRPDLLLLVRAPEDMEGPGRDGILHVSSDIRQGAGLKESYVIRIATQKLSEAGVAVPSSLSINTDEPESLIQKVSLSVARQVRINEEVRKIAGQQVTAERDRKNQIQQAVESRFLEKLTGVPARLAERLNFVPPGGDVEATMFRAIRKNIENTINKNRAKGFLVLSAELAFEPRDYDHKV